MNEKEGGDVRNEWKGGGDVGNEEMSEMNEKEGGDVSNEWKVERRCHRWKKRSEEMNEK